MAFPLSAGPLPDRVPFHVRRNSDWWASLLQWWPPPVICLHLTLLCILFSHTNSIILSFIHHTYIIPTCISQSVTFLHFSGAASQESDQRYPDFPPALPGVQVASEALCRFLPLEEQRSYSELLPGDRTPHPISKGGALPPTTCIRDLALSVLTQSS